MTYLEFEQSQTKIPNLPSHQNAQLFIAQILKLEKEFVLMAIPPAL
jgi:hypothetical protein